MKPRSNYMKRSILLMSLILLVIAGCKKKSKTDTVPPVVIVSGCTDPEAMNYNQNATQNDGSCQFADIFLPMRVGNYWLLQDTVSIPIPGFQTELPINITLDMDKDTVINGKNYFMMTQSIEVINSPIPGGGGLPATRFGYRKDRSGQIYRIVPGDSTEYIFVDYPLEVGKSWEDNSSSPASYSVTGTQLMYVPAINKSVVAWKIAVTSNTTGGTPIDLYFAKDYGVVRQEIQFNVMGFNIGVDAFLQEITLP
jgi:hypothetical protein